MPKPRRLSGSDVIKILEQLGFSIENQHGSHIKLVRFIRQEKQVLVISNHKELKTGAIVGIYRQAMHYVSEDDLRAHFYTE